MASCSNENEARTRKLHRQKQSNTTVIDWKPLFIWKLSLRLNRFIWIRKETNFKMGRGENADKNESLVEFGSMRVEPKIDEGTLQRFLGENVLVSFTCSKSYYALGNRIELMLRQNHLNYKRHQWEVGFFLF